jgi:hypothetical protein
MKLFLVEFLFIQEEKINKKSGERKKRPRKRIGGAIPNPYRDTGPRLEFALL